MVYKAAKELKEDHCEKNALKCINQIMPENYEQIISLTNDMFVGNELNLKYFRNFRYHLDHRVSHEADLQASNKQLYKEFMSKKISEPKVDNLVRPSLENNAGENNLANATFVSLTSNKDMKGIMSAVKQIEDRFNHKFHYPWTFINDKPFTNKFIKKIKSVTSSECQFVTINSKLWSRPSWIDPELQDKGALYLKEKNIQYANKESYHNMCRFYSGAFYNLPELQNFKYYWRVEPDTNYFCDIDYDVFKFMQDNHKTYGFTINVYDEPETIRSLWDTTVDFIKDHPSYLHPNGSYDWLLQDLEHPTHNKITKGYSTCHFWSNFEIADMDFFRSEAYTEWFNHLDRNGGFYYERWGDAPVHSVGLGLFEDKANIHWFRDIGYSHSPYLNCPNSDKCSGRCQMGQFTPFENNEAQNCMANWIKYSMSPEDQELY